MNDTLILLLVAVVAAQSGALVVFGLLLLRRRRSQAPRPLTFRQLMGQFSDKYAAQKTAHKAEKERADKLAETNRQLAEALEKANAGGQIPQVLRDVEPYIKDAADVAAVKEIYAA